MSFTPPSSIMSSYEPRVMIEIVKEGVRVSKSNSHSQNDQIRRCLEKAGWEILQARGDSYTVTSENQLQVTFRLCTTSL